MASAAASAATFARLLTFGAGVGLFGLNIADATLFGSYTKSYAKSIYDTHMRASDGQQASVHFGEKYPVAQTLYTGFQQSAQSIYNPLPQISQEDLGIGLKVTPHVTGDGAVALDVEAEYKNLGSITIDSIPSIDQRKFAGNVILREDQWAVLMGLDSKSNSLSRNGIAGLVDVPGVNEILSENTRQNSTSQTLILIKPRIIRFPVSATTSPQYLLGPAAGSEGATVTETK